MEKNSIATRKDFEAAQDASRHVERVVLPRLGKAVLLRRPSPLWFIFRGALPKSLALAALSSAENEQTRKPAGVPAPEEFDSVARWIIELLSEVVLQPRISLSPGPEEIPPEAISDEDLNFIIRWAMGEVATGEAAASSAGGLARFHAE
ncbi:MAG: hypothetical protein ACRD1N_00385 [Terriglobia bacterium]